MKEPTEKQKRAAELLSCGNVRNRREALVSAGYSEGVADKPKRVLESEGFKSAAEPFLKALKAERDAAIEAMKIKRDDADYSSLRSAVTDFTKLEQLLGGEATENLKISWEE